MQHRHPEQATAWGRFMSGEGRTVQPSVLVSGERVSSRPAALRPCLSINVEMLFYVSPRCVKTMYKTLLYDRIHAS